MKLFLTSVAAASLAASSAIAADLPSRKIAPVAPVMTVAPVFSWTGLYAGVNGGYGFSANGSKVKSSVYAARPGRPGRSVRSDRKGGFVGGGQLGYNYQIGSVVVGLETDINYADLRQRVNAGRYDARTRVNWFGTVRPRIGFLPTERLMVFGTGGLAYGDVSTKAERGAVNFVRSGKDSKVRVGWTLGGGLEYALTDNVSLKGEYDYVDLGSKKLRLAGVGGVSDGASRKTQFHVIRAGLNYRF